MVSLHISLAIALFFITNWIGQHSLHVGYIQLSILAKTENAPAFNFIYRAFSPVVFILLVSAVFYAIGLDWAVRDIYLVVVYYFIFRILFNLVTGKAQLLNWVTQACYVFVSVPCAFFVYEKLIVNKEFLFPSNQDIGTAVWLGVIAYVYHTANSIQASSRKTQERKTRYLKSRYIMYDAKYGSLIRGIVESKDQEMIAMAIIIFEAFNRPLVYRYMERALFRFGLAKTLGVMQVTTERDISDFESVSLGVEKIVKDYKLVRSKSEPGDWKNSEWIARRSVVSMYNKDDSYVDEVLEIYDELVRLFAPQLNSNEGN